MFIDLRLVWILILLRITFVIEVGLPKEQFYNGLEKKIVKYVIEVGLPKEQFYIGLEKKIVSCISP